MKFIILDNHNDVLNRLFAREDDGKVTIGTAHTREPLATMGELSEWTLFSDYIMEGFVAYYLRFSRTDWGCTLEVRLTGMNRDQYVCYSIRDYIKWAGIKAEQV